MQSIKPPARLSIGWIPYWNLFPLKVELQRTFGNSLEFVTGHPAVVNKLLADGTVSLAPSSSVCLLRSSTLDMALPLGVASDGPVQSVYVGFGHDGLSGLALVRERLALLRDIFRRALLQHDHDLRRAAQMIFDEAALLPPVAPEQVPALTLSAASATSVSLTKLLWRLCFGDDALQRALAPALRRGAGELVIGDEALLRRGSFAQILDLGQVWKDLSGLPFVFAVWQTAGPAPVNGLRRGILEAAELASARMRVEPAAYLTMMDGMADALASVDLASYWKVIQYRLTPSHLAGLSLWLNLVRLCMSDSPSDAVLVKMARIAGMASVRSQT